MSYKSKDRQTGNLFSELLPFGGKLNLENRWIKLHDLIPWDELEGIYGKYFSRLGRPGKDSQLINGLLIVKHLLVMSDESVIDCFLENPYVQYFCGYDQFMTNREIEASTLTRMRKRLGVDYFKKFEDEILCILKERKIIKPKEQMVDSTIFPVNIGYPTDTGLIEAVRVWLVEIIKRVRVAGGMKEKVRTYCRKARAVYLRFQKKRKKTKKETRKARKQLLQFTIRNIRQLKKLLRNAGGVTAVMLKKIKIRLKVAEKIYSQQLEMLKGNLKSVEDRIVSFHRSHIRPMVRGKNGKDVEFGPKASVSEVDGYLFLDKFSTDAYHEGVVLNESISLHEERFGNKPEVIITDKIYGSRKNRENLVKDGIRASLVPLGRKSELSKEQELWMRKKQRKRNTIEGKIGTSKQYYGLERLRYKNEELNIRLGLMAMNLSTALVRI
ncbi:MAG: IS5 family transposase [Elusimicrobiota bacterium]